MKIKSIVLISIVLLFSFHCKSFAQSVVSGEMKQYHKTTVSIESPSNFVQQKPTFFDNRMNVTFTSPSGKIYKVPAYFAADGNAAESLTGIGNKWHCHITPAETGEWAYEVSFREGANIAVSLNPTEGTPITPTDGQTGSFTITSTDKTGDDFRAKGKFTYVGEYAAQFDNGEYYFEVGADSPETFLEYADISGTTANGSNQYTGFDAYYEVGDPLWEVNKGTEIIGVVNYLALQGMNVHYFLFNNIEGDGERAFPFTGGRNNPNFDIYNISKLAQWQIIFDHMYNKGIAIEMVLSEDENTNIFERRAGISLDQFSNSRKIYYRELIARFGYLNVFYNIGEEVNWIHGNGSIGSGIDAFTAAQVDEAAQYIQDLSPYEDLITVHNGPSGVTPEQDNSFILFPELSGLPTAVDPDNTTAINCISYQANFEDPEHGNDYVIKLRNLKRDSIPSTSSGSKKWVVRYTEPYAGVEPDLDLWTENSLWASLCAGSVGIHYYSYNGDINGDNYLLYEPYYVRMRYAKEFYEANQLPFWDMSSANELINSPTIGYLSTDINNNYFVAFLPDGGSATIDLPGSGDISYNVKWFDPRNGGTLLDGSVSSVSFGTDTSIGNPPNSTTESWVALLTRSSLASNLITIAQEDFDGSSPTWANDISSQTFVDPSSSGEGLFIQASTNIGFGNTALGQDLEGEAGEPTLSPFTFTFEEVSVSNFSDLILSFDYYVFANADEGSYQLVIDGVPQASVQFYNDPETLAVQGTVTQAIGTASSVGLIITGTLNGALDVIELDNFRLQGNYEGDLIYASGTWTPNAPSASTGTDDALIQNGTYTTLSDISLNSISVLDGAGFEISPTDVLTVNSAIYNNGSFIFLSDNSSTSQLDAFTGIIVGDITVERYITNRRAYRLLSAPVGGQTFAEAWQQDTHITGIGGASNGFDVTETNNPSLFIFNNSTVDQSGGVSWEAINNTNLNAITAGTPYRLFLRGDRSIDLTNNEAPANATTLRTTGVMLTGGYSPVLATTPNNYSFVGNPYQATVDFNQVTKSNLTNFIYSWDASIAGENGNGGYVTIEVSSGSITAPPSSSSDASQFITPGQAFFVQNTAAGTGSITFEEADKATSESQVTIFSDYTNFYINSRLYKTSDLESGAMESDAIGLRFSENFTTLASDEDASKLANPDENYAINNNGFRSIDNQNIPVDGHQINLFLTNYQARDYSLTFSMGNKPEDLRVYLIDDFLHTETDLNAETTYSFTVDTSIAQSIDPNRFILNFEEVALNQQTFNQAQVQLYPNPVLTTLEINIPDGLEMEALVIFNMQGQEIISSKRTSIDLSNLSTGVYLVEITTAKEKIIKKIIKH